MSGFGRRTLLQMVAIAVLAAVGGRRSGTADPRYRLLAFGDIGELTTLPDGEENRFALTVDDGLSVEVVAAYAEFCRDSGTRLTFFVNGINNSWAMNAPALVPMIESGQIQVGNHTWSHPDITTLSRDRVAEEISRNAQFLSDTFGVDGTPYFRPPYGHHNAETDEIAAELGYSKIALWSSSIGDSEMLDDAELVANAQRCFEPGQIVLGHANLPPVTRCYTQLVDIIRQRDLRTVTLRDAFG
jgi:peptidoglycan-N-acetylglucosamine deacetylase